MNMIMQLKPLMNLLNYFKRGGRFSSFDWKQKKRPLITYSLEPTKNSTNIANGNDNSHWKRSKYGGTALLCGAFFSRKIY